MIDITQNIYNTFKDGCNFYHENKNDNMTTWQWQHDIANMTMTIQHWQHDNAKDENEIVKW